MTEKNLCRWCSQDLLNKQTLRKEQEKKHRREVNGHPEEPYARKS